MGVNLQEHLKALAREAMRRGAVFRVWLAGEGRLRFSRAMTAAGRGLAVVLRGTAAVLRAAWQAIKGPLLRVIEVAFALVVLFEEWGWRPLVDLLGLLARFRPWARLELFIAGLPPYGALAALALPTSILFPLKLVAVYLLAKGMAATAGAVFFAAKIASTALIGRIFILTKPALMRIGWFARLYAWFVPWRDAVFAWIRASWVWRYGRAVKARVRRFTTRAWEWLRPALVRRWGDLRAWSRGTLDSLGPRIHAELVRFRLAARRVWLRLSGEDAASG